MIIKIILCGQNIAQNIADIEHFSLLQGVAFETQRLKQGERIFMIPQEKVL